jgi:hypothetical protein
MQIVRVVVQNPSFHPQNTSTIDDAGTVQRSFATLRMTIENYFLLGKTVDA